MQKLEVAELRELLGQYYFTYSRGWRAKQPNLASPCELRTRELLGSVDPHISFADRLARMGLYTR